MSNTLLDAVKDDESGKKNLSVDHIETDDENVSWGVIVNIYEKHQSMAKPQLNLHSLINQIIALHIVNVQCFKLLSGIPF